MMSFAVPRLGLLAPEALQGKALASGRELFPGETPDEGVLMGKTLYCETRLGVP